MSVTREEGVLVSGTADLDHPVRSCLNMACPYGEPDHRSCARIHRGVSLNWMGVASKRHERESSDVIATARAVPTRTLWEDSLSFRPTTKRNSGIPIMRKFAHYRKATSRKADKICRLDSKRSAFCLQTGSPIICLLGRPSGRHRYELIFPGIRSKANQ